MVNNSFLLDTWELSKGVFKKFSLDPLKNYQLGTVYNYVTRETIQNTHRASGDVEALNHILLHE
jgi:DNA polymerase III alpha subunit (gram-positive type)